MENNIISKIIRIQNFELLNRIAEDRYKTKDEKEEFIKKYYKKNYSSLAITKKDKIQKYQKKYDRIMKNNPRIRNNNPAMR